MVYNPRWFQVIIYIAVVGFPCLSAYMFYLAYEETTQNRLYTAAPFIFLGCGVAYISYIGLILAKYVSARVQYNDEGFEVELGENKNLYSWNDILRVKNHKRSQILRLFDCSGKTIYVVDHMTTGYPEFADKINEVLGF